MSVRNHQSMKVSETATDPYCHVNGCSVRRRTKGKSEIKVRIATLNVGSMTGRGREVVDFMERRVQILCVQETRWIGNKSKELGGEYKLVYSGANKEGWNGVGIILDKEMKGKLTCVNRGSERVMSVRVQLGDMVLNVLSVYAPQVNSDEEVKDAFWRDVECEAVK
uniref:Craniofacial development protein 2 n=1 Tax=Cacopsylla melanoneura TaxID=428564 RepID=A0A8D8W6D1_9HEMI